MYILGLNVGHNCTASLLKDGQIVGCVSEERFSRIKNQSGIPFESIAFLLKDQKISAKDLDLIVLDNGYIIKKDPEFGKKFLEAYTKKSKKKHLFSALGYKFPRLFKTYQDSKDSKYLSPRNQKSRALAIKSKISHALKFPKEKIEVIDHHYAHALASCFNLPKNRKTLVFSLDGEGNGLSATLNIYDGRSLKVLSKTSRSASLGYLYSIATMYLGMKPLQHEFKVMGLAAYAKDHNIDKIYDKFKKLIWIDKNLSFKSKFNMPFADHFFFNEMKFQRFDIISGALQRLTEDLTKEWVSRAIKKTKIPHVALTGGVFMNVKANMNLLELKDLKSLYVMPSCGDESNAIGSCFYGYSLLCKTKNLQFDPKPLEHLYLGPRYDETYISSLISSKDLKKKYTITKPKNINKEVAKLLAKGEIVARCSGKSEWGARALGNRSILANPKDKDTIRVLNETIKDRDFWMPFTPSMLDTSEKDYIMNPKKAPGNFMAITFPSTQKAQEDLPAAMHPYDFTIRPQLLKKQYNPDYYEIISEFKKLTKKGAILNTSFNLHGEPNVLTPEDALHTVENSSLKYLALEGFLLKKK